MTFFNEWYEIGMTTDIWIEMKLHDTHLPFSDMVIQTDQQRDNSRREIIRLMVSEYGLGISALNKVVWIPTED